MNAIYCGCIPNPWLDVAKKLNKENNLNPVYWVGWSKYDDNIDIKLELKNNFNDCIFHEAVMAWKGIFPAEVKNYKYVSLDGDLLNEIAKYELIAIKMMDRLDPDRKSFLFEERQRHFRMLLSQWLSIIDELKIDIFVSPSIPHRVFDYILYIACKVRNVKTMMFKLTPFRDVIIPITDIEYMPSSILKDFIQIKSGNLNVSLPEEILNAVQILQKSYNEAEPEYMKVQKKTNTPIYLHFLKRIFNLRSILKTFTQLFKETTQYHKVPNKDMEKVFIKKYQSIFFNFKALRYKNRLEKYYESLCSIIDVKKEKYIFVALHYQPEETTCPSAGQYVNQNLIIENISELLPNDIKIVVKEHSSQFHTKMEGHTGRNKVFYDDLIKLPNVVFISSGESSFDYIDNAIAVVTATGTIGWESVVRGKKVLIFGNAWYEYCDNVFKINSKNDLSKSFDNILSRKCNKAEFLSYVKAAYNNSIQAYHYQGYDIKSKVDKSTSVNNLSKSINSVFQLY